MNKIILSTISLMTLIIIAGCGATTSTKDMEKTMSESESEIKQKQVVVNDNNEVQSLKKEEQKIQGETAEKDTQESKEVIEVEKNVEKKSNKLSHDDLLNISNDNVNDILGKTVDMTLYLEQHPTNAKAEFMSQPNDNDVNTILITCNMDTNDIKKLDGQSAQQRIYKAYDLGVSFIEYNENAGLYYEANCKLK